MGYFDLQPERRPLHLNQDEDDPHELNIRAPVEIEIEPPHQSDVTTESAYSSIHIPGQDLPTSFIQTAVAAGPRLLCQLGTKTLPPK